MAALGPRRACAAALVRCTDLWFDWRHRVDTAQRVPLESLDVVGSNRLNGSRYQPTGASVFRALLEAVPFPRNVTFLDYGCGKGQVLLLAARAGFSSVIGVDFSPRLCEIARRNVESFSARGLGRSRIEIVEAEASRYDPPDHVGIFYLFHPFDAAVMSAVIDRIDVSLRRRPRPAWLIYHYPVHRQVIDQRAELSVDRALTLGGYDCLVYRHQPRVSVAR